MTAAEIVKKLEELLPSTPADTNWKAWISSFSSLVENFEGAHQSVNLEEAVSSLDGGGDEGLVAINCLLDVFGLFSDLVILGRFADAKRGEELVCCFKQWKSNPFFHELLAEALGNGARKMEAQKKAENWNKVLVPVMFRLMAAGVLPHPVIIKFFPKDATDKIFRRNPSIGGPVASTAMRKDDITKRLTLNAFQLPREHPEGYSRVITALHCFLRTPTPLGMGENSSAAGAASGLSGRDYGASTRFFSQFSQTIGEFSLCKRRGLALLIDGYAMGVSCDWNFRHPAHPSHRVGVAAHPSAAAAVGSSGSVEGVEIASKQREMLAVIANFPREVITEALTKKLRLSQLAALGELQGLTTDPDPPGKGAAGAGSGKPGPPPLRSASPPAGSGAASSVSRSAFPNEPAAAPAPAEEKRPETKAKRLAAPSGDMPCPKMNEKSVPSLSDAFFKTVAELTAFGLADRQAIWDEMTYSEQELGKAGEIIMGSWEKVLVPYATAMASTGEEGESMDFDEYFPTMKKELEMATVGGGGLAQSLETVALQELGKKKEAYRLLTWFGNAVECQKFRFVAALIDLNLWQSASKWIAYLESFGAKPCDSAIVREALQRHARFLVNTLKAKPSSHHADHVQKILEKRVATNQPAAPQVVDLKKVEELKGGIPSDLPFSLPPRYRAQCIPSDPSAAARLLGFWKESIGDSQKDVKMDGEEESDLLMEGADPCRAFEDIATHLEEVLTLMGPQGLAADSSLLFQLASLVAGWADSAQSRAMEEEREHEKEKRRRRKEIEKADHHRILTAIEGGDQFLPRELDKFIADFLFPALSLSAPCLQIHDALWETITKFSVNRRYELYALWEDAYYDDEKPIMLLARRGAEKKADVIAKRTTADAYSNDDIPMFLKYLRHACVRLGMTNPIQLFQALLNRVRQPNTDNLIAPYTKHLETMPPLGIDVLVYCASSLQLAEKADQLARPERMKILRNYADFIGNLFKEHISMDLQPLIASVTSNLTRNPEAVDRIYIEKLLEHGAGMPLVKSMNDDQLEELAGGPALRAISLNTARLSKDRDALKGAPKRRGMFKRNIQSTLDGEGLLSSLISALGKTIMHFKWKSKKDLGEAGLVEVLKDTADEISRTVYILANFAAMYLKPEEFREKMPVKEECFKFFEPALAWTVYRPQLPDFLPSQKEEEAVKGPSAEVREALALARAAAITKQARAGGDVEMNGGDTGADPFTFSPKAYFRSAHERAELEKIATLVREHVPSADFRTSSGSLAISFDLFACFWRLSLKDICCPNARYEVQTRDLRREIQTTVAQIERATSRKTRNELETVKKAAETTLHELEKEHNERRVHFAEVKKRLAKHKDHFFPSQSAEGLKAFLSLCVLPRITASPQDALFCARFAETLVSLDCKGFVFLEFLQMAVTTVFKVRANTEGEAEGVAVFLRELLRYTWRIAEGLEKKEEKGNRGQLSADERKKEEERKEKQKEVELMRNQSVHALCSSFEALAELQQAEDVAGVEEEKRQKRAQEVARKWRTSESEEERRKHVSERVYIETLVQIEKKIYSSKIRGISREGFASTASPSSASSSASASASATKAEGTSLVPRTVSLEERRLDLIFIHRMQPMFPVFRSTFENTTKLVYDLSEMKKTKGMEFMARISNAALSLHNVLLSDEGRRSTLRDLPPGCTALPEPQFRPPPAEKPSAPQPAPPTKAPPPPNAAAKANPTASLKTSNALGGATAKTAPPPAAPKTAAAPAKTGAPPQSSKPVQQPKQAVSAVAKGAPDSSPTAKVPTGAPRNPLAARNPLSSAAPKVPPKAAAASPAAGNRTAAPPTSDAKAKAPAEASKNTQSASASSSAPAAGSQAPKPSAAAGGKGTGHETSTTLLQAAAQRASPAALIVPKGEGGETGTANGTATLQDVSASAKPNAGTTGDRPRAGAATNGTGPSDSSSRDQQKNEKERGKEEKNPDGSTAKDNVDTLREKLKTESKEGKSLKRPADGPPQINTSPPPKSQKSSPIAADGLRKSIEGERASERGRGDGSGGGGSRGGSSSKSPTREKGEKGAREKSERERGPSQERGSKKVATETQKKEWKEDSRATSAGPAQRGSSSSSSSSSSSAAAGVRGGERERGDRGGRTGGDVAVLNGDGERHRRAANQGSGSFDLTSLASGPPQNDSGGGGRDGSRKRPHDGAGGSNRPTAVQRSNPASHQNHPGGSGQRQQQPTGSWYGDQQNRGGSGGRNALGRPNSQGGRGKQSGGK
uniref:THO complex subunit 2 n=1 Tax=Chromera velia CCMP2878 TaxID=1169474 RepID=A0A0G4H9J4_9ALVE|eukprot:Cvel_6001.t1-p1 / transcript=Cvel_6001.t1 / gene=Cvel_6001 / organism=Chromera_velia_CCMP2878 / gene_product=THO complex subunit 2, putative / transcript_product=THO complex subunit 2, putative / location=Cvel_scaffold287:46394-60977(+) / protein_length=2250 / sequence_SO=supercontig / SO=protein_coding / is_pseudo=false